MFYRKANLKAGRVENEGDLSFFGTVSILRTTSAVLEILGTAFVEGGGGVDGRLMSSLWAAAFSVGSAFPFV